MPSIYLSAPAIARLILGSTMNVNRAMRSGAFGPLLERRPGPDRVLRWAALPAVERHAGRRFTTEQINAATAGRPDRLIFINPEN